MLPIELPESGNAIAVTQYRRSDLAELFLAIDHATVWAHIPGLRPRTPDDLTTRMTRMTSDLEQQPLVIRAEGEVVGTSSYFLNPADPSGVEIGATLLSPRVWGSGLNTAVKQVMLNAAFDAGAQWVQLRTDERNHRSAAAILKLPDVVEIEPRIEPQWIRPDGTVRTSRMFRIRRPTTRAQARSDDK